MSIISFVVPSFDRFGNETIFKNIFLHDIEVHMRIDPSREDQAMKENWFSRWRKGFPRNSCGVLWNSWRSWKSSTADLANRRPSMAVNRAPRSWERVSFADVSSHWKSPLNFGRPYVVSKVWFVVQVAVKVAVRIGCFSTSNRHTSRWHVHRHGQNKNMRGARPSSDRLLEKAYFRQSGRTIVGSLCYDRHWRYPFTTINH